MAGTLFGIPLSQRFDVNGTPLAGCLLYVYDAGTSTPAATYQDSALTSTLAMAFPIVADATGLIPQFWVDDGQYRARLTTSGGTEVFDEDGILAIGPSSGSSGGGSGISVTAVFQTGDPLWLPVSLARTGWVRLNGLTIGSASSGGTERASSDTQTLYEYKWANFTNSICPVSGGRGATALADFNANKAMGTIDMRGISAFGLDTMGNSAAGRLVAGTPTVAASFGGAERQTIAQVNLPVAALSAASLTGSVGTTITNGTQLYRGTNLSDNVQNSGGSKNNVPDGTTAGNTVSLASGTVTFGGSVPLGGSATPLATTPPYRLGTWYMKL